MYLLPLRRDADWCLQIDVMTNSLPQDLAAAATKLLASPMASTSPPVKTISVQIVKLIGAPQTRKPPGSAKKTPKKGKKSEK